MLRLPYLLIVLLVAAIPLAAQSKTRTQPRSVKRPFYRPPQVKLSQPYYRPIQPATNGAQLNKRLLKAFGTEKAAVLIARAKYYLAAGLDENAGREFARALNIDADNETLVANVTSLITTTGIVEQCGNAARLASDYLNNHPKSLILLIEKAKARSCAGRFEEAFDDISTVIETDNLNRNFRSQRESYLLRFTNRDYALATRQRIIDDLEKLNAIAPSSSSEKFPVDILMNEYLRRARYYDYLEKFDLELADLNRAVEIFPEFALMPRATFFRKQKSYAEAIADLDRGIVLLTKRNGDLFTTSMFEQRAEIFIMLGRYDDAIADYQKCLSISPRRAVYYEAKISQTKEMINK